MGRVLPGGELRMLLGDGEVMEGRWKMDAFRSEFAQQAVPIGTVVLIVKQTSTRITIESRRTEPGKTEVQSEVLPFLLDGGETTTTILDSPVKTKAHWDGTKLITETERTVNGASVTTRNVLTLDANGKEVKVERMLTVRHGNQSEVK